VQTAAVAQRVQFLLLLNRVLGRFHDAWDEFTNPGQRDTLEPSIVSDRRGQSWLS